MTGAGILSKEPSGILKRLLVLQGAWLALVSGLGVWWGILILRLADRVYELERALGTPLSDSAKALARTRRIIIWESGAFFTLLTGLLAFLFVTHWRELARSRSVQAFFASLTHELRTPLTSIRLQAESILERTDGGGENSKLLHRMMEDVARLEGQVNQALELARLEGGGGLFVQSIELRSFLDRFAEKIHPVLGKPLHIETPDGDGETWISADVTALETIFRNLTENAMKHGARHDRPGVKLRFKIEETADRVFLTAVDDGPGVPSASRKLGRLFEKGETSRGAGVGLYLIRSLLSRMGGSVEFGNALEGGFEARLSFGKGGHA